MKKFTVKGCKVVVFHIHEHTTPGSCWHEIFASEQPSWAVMVGGNVYTGYRSRKAAVSAIDGQIL